MSGAAVDRAAVLAALTPMKVDAGGYGGVIEAKAQREACEKLLAKGTFSSNDMMVELKNSGAPEGAAYRGADRLLQKLRHAGLIRANRKKPSLGWDVL